MKNAHARWYNFTHNGTSQGSFRGGTHGNGVPIVKMFKNAQNSSQVEKKIKTVLDSYLMPNQES